MKSGSKKRKSDIGRIEVPQSTFDVVWRRLENIVRHEALYADNVLQSIAISCYLQGAVDALQPMTKEAFERYKAEALCQTELPDTSTSEQTVKGTSLSFIRK